MSSPVEFADREIRRTTRRRALREFRTSFTAVSGGCSHLSEGGAMGMPQLIVTAVLVEGRSKSEGAARRGGDRRGVLSRGGACAAAVVTAAAD
jgi:hypothetical protein